MTLTSMLRVAAIAIVAATSAAQAAPQAALPSASVYQLAANLQDQDGKSFTFASLRGKPLVISMFYTSCEYVCPMLVDTIERDEQALSADERAQLKTLLVTFDPERDDAATLKTTAQKRNLDPARWTLARTDAATVRKLAAVLGIQYRKLQNGDFNHSTIVVLLDTEGRVVASTSKMGAVDPDFVAALKKTVHAKK
ncbi:MAG TPA: SCO family protein [Telluria sp.]|nr:SCO family protein [Telluria sp.]